MTMTLPPIIESLYENNTRRKAESIFRTVSAYRDDAFEKNCIDLSSNSYLALQNCIEVNDEAARLCENKFYGNMASRLIAQSSPLCDELEREIAQWKNCESALVFNSGYAANIGIIAAMCDRHTEIFCDKLNHASIINGCKLSGAKLLRYRHNDMKHLEELLQNSSAQKKLIVSDTIFSMDGDVAPLADICELGKKYSCAIMVDEAHATGVFGKRASGLVEEAGVEDDVHIRMGTLSKAVAGLGGFFAGSCEIKNFLVNNAGSFIYSTALPHSVCAYNLTAVRYIRKNPHVGKVVRERAKTLREQLTNAGFNCINSVTQIIPILCGGAKNAIELSAYLRDNNIIAPAIRTPTVPKGTERVRFSVHAGIGDSDIEKILEAVRVYKAL